MLSAIISKIGVPVLISILTEALNAIDSPATKGAAKALGDVDAAIRAGQISNEQMAEANRHMEKMAEIQMQENTATAIAVNETLRTEVASSDPYVRRMRPTFGYLMGFTWAAQMFGIAYVIIFQTEKSAFVINAMDSLSTIWAMGLSVLGIYVYRRSTEKKSIAPGAELIGWNKRK